MLTVVALFFGLQSVGIAAEPMSKLLADFSDASATRQWLAVNDTVMGGVSEGVFRITEDKTLEFSGTLSLENQGGFTSIRTRPADLNLGDYDRIALRLKGDGRTYYLNLMTASQTAAASYRAPIPTMKDSWQEVRVDLEDFVLTYFGRTVTGASPLKADDVRSMGITLADKKSGPFRLEVAWIKAEKRTATEDGGTAPQGTAPTATRDIVDIAAAAGGFDTLVAAVKAAGLVEALKGPGPLTVFAPTDEAFAKLPEGTVESLLKPENRDQLASILTYHVVPGQITAEEAAELPKVDTAQGASLLISAKGDKVRVDGAAVVKADIAASNGVIHVIDTVLLPKDIVSTAEAAGQFNTLLTAVEAAGLVDALKGEGPLTVFAPTDGAFAALPDGTVEDLLRPENRQKLTAILKYHVVTGEISLGGRRVKTLQGNEVDIRPTGDWRVDEAKVLLADIRVTNGVVHIIDRVLLPPLPEPTAIRRAMGVIELAIERGVPLYNAHRPEACAAIYEVAAKSLLDGHKEALDDAAQERLAQALADIRKDHRASRQAWILRYALDDVYRTLRDRR